MSGAPRRTNKARGGPALVAVTVVVAAVAAALGLLGDRGVPRAAGNGPSAPSERRSSGSATTAGTTTAPPASEPAAAASGRFAVGFTSLTVTEPGTVLEPPYSGSPGPTPRTLPTVVRYPAVGPEGALEGEDAPADRAQAPFPLVVFSQGYEIPPEAYARLLDTWAASGYVVAAPTYPLTDPNSPGGPDEADIVHHPADLRAVIATLLSDAGRPGGLLSGLVDPHEVAVVGHSDGGDVSLAVAANTCCKDPAVTAAVILSGAELSSFGGSYFTDGSVPLLVVQGSADEVNVPGCSVELYDEAPPPKYYLSLEGVGHREAYLDAGEPETVVAAVTTDFLDAYLKHQAGAVAAMRAAAAVPGLATLSDAASLGPPGPCPGAPPP